MQIRSVTIIRRMSLASVGIAMAGNDHHDQFTRGVHACPADATIWARPGIGEPDDQARGSRVGPTACGVVYRLR